VSKAEVASSKIRILGFLARALAIEILCFCPPDKKLPLVPTDLRNPCGSSEFYGISSFYYI
jgi:hypothetical protein